MTAQEFKDWYEKLPVFPPTQRELAQNILLRVTMDPDAFLGVGDEAPTINDIRRAVVNEHGIIYRSAILAQPVGRNSDSVKRECARLRCEGRIWRDVAVAMNQRFPQTPEYTEKECELFAKTWINRAAEQISQ